jgi:hypothetical protein
VSESGRRSCIWRSRRNPSPLTGVLGEVRSILTLLVLGVVSFATACSPTSSNPAASETAPPPTVPPSGVADQRSGDDARCDDGAEWCASRTEGVPATLLRPLRFPRLQQGSCPTTSGRRYDNGQFAGLVLGAAPVQPLIAPDHPSHAGEALRGILIFDPASKTKGMYRVKTLWFARPRYQGPILIRGRQLDGPHKPSFGEEGSLLDPMLSAGPTINGEHGFREWPGATWVPRAGCYAWQVDGTNFSDVIIFRADLRRGST